MLEKTVSDVLHDFIGFTKEVNQGNRMAIVDKVPKKKKKGGGWSVSRYKYLKVRNYITPEELIDYFNK